MNVLAVGESAAPDALMAPALGDHLAVFTTPACALEHLRARPYAAVVLRLSYPRCGVTLAAIRAVSDVPFLAIVTGDRDERAALLRLGADDAQTEGICARELKARIAALLRRCAAGARNALTVGPLTVDLDRRTVSIDEAPLALTRKEYELLELLARRAEQVVPKNVMLDHLYHGVDEPQQKIIDVFVCKLRKKLAAAGASGMLACVWGRGYSLSADADTAAEDLGIDRPSDMQRPLALADVALFPGA